MSEQPTPDIESEAPSEFDPITSQEAFDKRVAARIARERAKYADYNDLKTKAQKLEEIESASKSEAQKAQEQVAQLQKELEAERFNTVRNRVASKHGVPAHRISGSTEEELDASAADYLAEISELGKSRQQKPPSALKSGATANDQRLDPKEKAAAMVAQMFRSGG